jgi:hypothetical protein
MSWSPQTGTFQTYNKSWSSIASDSSGDKLVACISGESIWRSTDKGETWTQTSSPADNWISVASNEMGDKLVACILNGDFCGKSFIRSQKNGKILAQFNDHKSPVKEVMINLALKMFISCSIDGLIVLHPYI